jgi:hypothetical protein
MEAVLDADRLAEITAFAIDARARAEQCAQTATAYAEQARAGRLTADRAADRLGAVRRANSGRSTLPGRDTESANGRPWPDRPP